MPSGGYRKPANPAAVSGPGAMSRRTDGQPMMDLPDAKYGEAKNFAEIQQGAPMASAQPLSGGGGGLDLSQIVGLGEGTTRPNEPVTSGAAMGAGPGPEALGLPRSDLQQEAQTLARKGYLQAMIRIADSDSATPEYRRYVRELVANL